METTHLYNFLLPFDPTNFKIFLSDSAVYILKCGSNLKVFHCDLLHVTCIAHAVHRISKWLRESFPAVKQPISLISKKNIHQGSSPFSTVEWSESWSPAASGTCAYPLGLMEKGCSVPLKTCQQSQKCDSIPGCQRQEKDVQRFWRIQESPSISYSTLKASISFRHRLATMKHEESPHRKYRACWID